MMRRPAGFAASALVWLALSCAWVWAITPTEANTASEADLDSVRGLGPPSTRLILAQRPFTDWQDFMRRVPGIGPQRARQLSQQGLTVAGQAYSPPLR